MHANEQKDGWRGSKAAAEVGAGMVRFGARMLRHAYWSESLVEDPLPLVNINEGA